MSRTLLLIAFYPLGLATSLVRLYAQGVPLPEMRFPTLDRQPVSVIIRQFLSNHRAILSPSALMYGE